MNMLVVLVITKITLVAGFSLWSLPDLKDIVVDFTVDEDNSSVLVKAFIKDQDSVNVDYKKNIKFLLFNRRYKKGIQLQRSTTFDDLGFDFNSSIKILIHGFADTVSSDFNIFLRNAYRKQQDCSVIAVDWSELCRPPFYADAVDNAHRVGGTVAQLIAWLGDRGVDMARIHMLGYSVGAHIAGIAAHHLRVRGGRRVGRITGLDPAKPMFELHSRDQLLTADDANFVDCIHTCGGYLGLSDPICSADFYPNGGTNPQPGCTYDLFGKCSHQRAYKYFVESVLVPKSFPVVQCSTVEGYSPDNCSTVSTTTMGEHTDIRASGIFYLATASSPPYSVKDSTDPANLDFLVQFSWYFH